MLPRALPASLLLASLLAAPIGVAAEGQPVALPSEGLLRAAFMPLGDADGDGRDDLAFLYWAWAGEGMETVHGAIGLADAGRKELWRLEGRQDHGWTPDLDGNGVADLYVRAQAEEGAATGASALVAGASTSSHGPEEPAQVKDGASLRDVGVLPLGGSWSDSQAYAFPPTAFALIGQARHSWSWSAVVAPGEVFSEELRAHSSVAYVGTLAESAFTVVDDSDATYAVADAAGARRAVLEVAGPGVEPRMGLPGRFDGTRALGVAAAWWTAPPHVYSSALPVGGAPAVQAHVAMAMGDDGPAWTVDRPPAPLFESVLLPAGDLDGDGAEDLQYVEMRLGLDAATDLEGVTTETLLLDGATGEVLHSDVRTGQVAAYFPFTAARGSGDGRILRMVLDLGAEQASWDVLPRFDAAPAWSIPMGGAFPLNAEFDAAGFPAFADLDGDGRPDLLMGEGAQDGKRLEAAAYAGLDGRLLWTASLDGFAGLSPLPGDGGAGLLVLKATGDEGEDDPEEATAGFDVLDGATGTLRWRQTLRSPGTIPVEAEDGFWLEGRPVGDVDGDGAADFTVTLFERATRESSDSSMVYHEPSAYLFATASRAAAAAATADAGNATDGAGPAGLPPAEAPPGGEDGDEDGRGTPGLPMWAAVAALAAAALASRRRR
jgi:hypothetical protein